MDPVYIILNEGTWKVILQNVKWYELIQFVTLASSDNQFFVMYCEMDLKVYQI